MEQPDEPKRMTLAERIAADDLHIQSHHMPGDSLPLPAGIEMQPHTEIDRWWCFISRGIFDPRPGTMWTPRERQPVLEVAFFMTRPDSSTRAGAKWNGNIRNQFRKPQLPDVLEALLSETAGYDQARGFWDWCGEYGYDIDSVRAAAIYKDVGVQAEKVRAFFGEQLDAYLYETDRD